MNIGQTVLFSSAALCSLGVTDALAADPPLFAAFYADQNARVCKNCGAIHPGKRPPPGWANL